MDTLNRAKQLQDRTKKFAVRIIKGVCQVTKGRSYAGYWATIPPIGNFAGCELSCRLSSEIERRLYFKDYCCERGSRRNPLLAGAAYRLGTNHQQESRIAND